MKKEKPALDDENLAQWLKLEAYDYVPVRRGDLRKGTIMAIGQDGIVVDIGSKQDALIPQHDLESVPDEVRQSLDVGVKVHVLVHRIAEDGIVIVSLSEALQESDWLRAVTLLESGDLVEGSVIGVNRGGVMVQFGRLTAFVPASHLTPPISNRDSSKRMEKMEAMIGQTVILKVVEVNRRRHRLICSQREAKETLRQRALDRLVGSLHVGDRVQGKVHTITSFGVFVELGGADGLVHITEMSWRPLRSPRELVNVGDVVEAMVIRVDREKKQIALSIKQLEPNPWEGIDDRYRPGDVIQAIITNVLKFGAFARLEDGIEGLIHISQLSSEPIQSPEEVVHVGDMVNVRVLEVSEAKRRISLSLKQAPQVEKAPVDEENSEVPSSESEVVV